MIGIAVVRLTHSAFRSAGNLGRWLWAAGSLYIGAILFGLTIGVYDILSRGSPSHATERLFEPTLGILWGITLTGFLIFLWPLAYFTHRLIEWRLDEIGG